MSTRKSTFFYAAILGPAMFVSGMVIASRFGLAPASSAGTLSVPATNSAPLNGPIDATTFRNIAHDQSPAVVSIQVKSKQQVQSMQDLFGFQMQPGQGRRQQQAPQEIEQLSAGSGFIIDKSGFILTNNHVIENASEITVFLEGADRDPNNDGLAAKIVGRDLLTDSALLQLTEMPTTPLSEVKFGDSDQLGPGDWVMAIGNPFGLANSVSVGVVSAVGRPYEAMRIGNATRVEEMIQTDAAINHGNSGGPLLNVRGEVIGMNTAIVSTGENGNNIGIGFAVPINKLKSILQDLHQGKVVRGRIGVNVQALRMSADQAKKMYGLSSVMGALVTNVEANGPAGAAGMRNGDVVIEYNGKQLKDQNELVAAVTGTAPGTVVPMKVVRVETNASGAPAPKTLTLNVKIGELDLDAEQQQQVATTRPSRALAPDAPKDTDLGMSISALSGDIARRARLPQGRGAAVVQDLQPGSPASQGGVVPGDIILSVNYQTVSSVDDVATALSRVSPRGSVVLLVWRAGEEQVLQIRKK